MTCSGEGNGKPRFGRSLYLGFALLSAPGFPGSSCLAPGVPTNYSVDQSTNSIEGDVMGEAARKAPAQAELRPTSAGAPRRSACGITP
jgi:hypothetical protein